jgi:hypothetical protein
MYAKYARELTAATNGSEQYNAVRGLQDALTRRRPERDTFVAAFVEKLVLTNEINRDKKLVQYVLRRLLKADHPRTEGQSLTVEHILPQESIGTSAELTGEVVGSIGNLLLVDDVLNGKLGSKDFQTKRRILQDVQSNYPVSSIVSARTWGPSEIRARAVQLAEDAYDRVWRLPVH